MPKIGATWNSEALQKEAKHGFFYHLAPREHRESIETNGLLPTDSAPSSPWSELNQWQRSEQPPGVYMWDDPMNARGYAYNLEGRAGDGEYPGDREQEELPDSYYEYMEQYPGKRDEYGDPVDEYDYDDYLQGYKPEPLYDIWKVNTLGFPKVHLDPETALYDGEMTAEEAQQQINHEVFRHREPDRMEGHRWYVPHAVEPGRLALHDSIYPEEMTMNDAEETMSEGKQVPNAWHQVPLDEWNQKARERYLGNPNLMREIDPQDRTV